MNVKVDYYGFETDEIFIGREVFVMRSSLSKGLFNRLNRLDLFADLLVCHLG
jgi:hypothetical protein